MSDAPPAVRNINYELVKGGVWLQVVPAVGNPTTVFIPDRMLANLGKIMSKRAELVKVDKAREAD